MSVSIKYKGAEIASASTNVTKTIKTSGKYCEGDIEVINTPDGGDAPVINSLSVTANGTYTAPSGVDGYSPINVNVPQGITPSGNINITDTNVTDVTNYATAQVVDADLVAENIKKNVNILGVVGTFEGGGGVSGVERGSFTFPNDVQCDGYNITHTLGVVPSGFVVWTTENAEAEAYAQNTLIACYAFVASTYTGGGTAYAGFTSQPYRHSNGSTTSTTSWQNNMQSWASASRITVGSNLRYKAGLKYNWVAWA